MVGGWSTRRRNTGARVRWFSSLVGSSRERQSAVARSCFGSPPPRLGGATGNREPEGEKIHLSTFLSPCPPCPQLQKERGGFLTRGYRPGENNIRNHTDGVEEAYDGEKTSVRTCGHDLCAQLPSHPSSQEQVKYGGPLHTCDIKAMGQGESDNLPSKPLLLAANRCT